MTTTKSVPMDDLIDRFVEVKSQYDELEKQLKKLTSTLQKHCELHETIASARGNKLRLTCRSQLNQEKFERRIGANRFARVSKRVAVAALYRAAVLKGWIAQEDVDDCMEPTRPWFSVVR